jgi:hypothetical protein
MEETFVPSDWKPSGRRIWSCGLPVDVPSGLLVFLDAELYSERVGAAEGMETLTAQGRIGIAPRAQLVGLKTSVTCTYFVPRRRVSRAFSESRGSHFLIFRRFLRF